MKTVSILLLHHVNLGSMENARNGLMEANTYLSMNGQPDGFKIQLVGIEPEIELQKGLYRIKADRTIDQVKKTDLIIIPPVQDDIPESLSANKEFFPWIRQRFDEGAEVMSLCLGAFILGGTGLLNGRKCVTHWKAAAQFQKLFPQVKLMPDKLLTDDNGIYTGGGAFSSANLILYAIEKFINREAAIYCSKIFQIDMGRTSQSEFIIFSGQKDHHDESIISIQTYVESNFRDKINIENLSTKFNIGRRTMERRFKQATGNTMIEYLQRTRVEQAKRELEKSRKTINEVMYDVGYSDAKTFRDVFRKYAGLSPIDYRNKYGLMEQSYIGKDDSQLAILNS
ncbi:GlxA family transcriptional regulator [Litoribacter populi]|uniref:GlxA family transcriptional regulator n=1 Tax=Litoribacter populi TaxID=2598460 RepID=UPI001180354C|nr:helix-turn-helix domain-containing protein [Litoribacter populi]